MSLGRELDTIAQAGEDAPEPHGVTDRREDHTPVEYLCSPAISEHALANVVPALQAEIEDLKRLLGERDQTIDNLRERIRSLAMPNGDEF